jgi:hypothetical protein
MVPGLQALLDDPTMADTLGLTFTAAAAAAAAGTASAGGAGEVELVPGGSQLGVEPGCVQQYVAALLDRKLLGGCSLQVGRVCCMGGAVRLESGPTQVLFML